jgi:hypothetical protein
MPPQVVAGAQLMCTFGAAPSALMVLPLPGTPIVEGKPAATIMDHVPMVNIMPFGMCTAPTNPTVIAKLGAPSPCIPATAAPWVPPKTGTLLSKKPALTSEAKCICTWAGVISVLMPGAMKTIVNK